MRRAASALGVLALGLAGAIIPATTASAATWGISKQEVSSAPYQPGQNVQWVVTVSCSDPNADPCTPTTITDELPEGMVLVSASIQNQSGATNGAIDADTGTNTVTYTADQVNNGGQVQILVTAQVDPDLPYSQDGVPITNTATVVSDNANEQSASDSITPTVPLVLDSEVTKSIEPSGALAEPGTPATITLGATNTSNDPVDTLVVQDPVDPTADPNPFTYLEYTGTGEIDLPPNATEVEQEYWDGSQWLPLDDSVDPSTVQGVRYTFSGDIQPGATATIPVEVQQSEAVTELTETTTIANDASSYVTHGDDQSDEVTADDDYVITPPDNSVEASKSFDPATVSAGDPTTVTIGATNTGTPVGTMTITEPAPDTDSPFEGDSPLTFTGFGPDGDGTGVTWPADADAATVTFTCADGSTPSEDTTTAGTLPNPPADCVVTEFSVTFTGDIVTGGEASIPFTADTDPEQDVDDLTHTNTIHAEVPNAEDTASADLVTLVDRLATETNKVISPSTIPAVPGQNVVVQLPSQLLPFGPDGSTANADQVVIQDPTDPADPGDFWGSFTATQVRSTDVPANATLTINYWNGTAWVAAPGCGPYTGPDTVSCDLPADAQGVQFVYDSTADGFPPGTQFQPNFIAEYTGDPDQDDPLTNCGASSASSGTVAPTEPAEGCATVDPYPVDPGTLDFISKTFLGGDPDTVLARSDDQVTAQITWSTNGFSGVDPMVISDIADPATTPIADSFYDAFDLVSIGAIDPSVDPLIEYDAITGVELFVDGTWVAASGSPCTVAAPCDGSFPGYTLTADERANATSVRLTYTESPSRTDDPDDPTTPAAGDGVARSTQADGRHLNLTFQVRDYKRSNGDAVLGSTNGTLYNVPDEPGLVNDTARGTATFDGDEYTDTDDADVLILDQPINVSVAKDWSGGPISVPPAETPDEFYPSTTVTVTGTNESNAKVEQLRLADPTATGSGDVVTADGASPFDAFTLTAIDLTPPEGAETTTVTLHYVDGSTADLDEAAAEALTAADLADVIGVEVAYDGLVMPGAEGSMALTVQLRETDRYTGDPVTVSQYSPVPNTSAATITDPGGTAEDDRLDNASDDMVLQDADIALEVSKSFDPDTVVEPNHGADGSDTPVVMTLSGTPQGPSRSVEMVLTDDDPQFWNQYDFAGFDPSAALVTPIQQVQVDVFTGGTFSGTAGSEDPVTVTGGAWVEGTPSSTFALPAGVDPADVQGLRFTFTRTDGSVWENPATPTQTVPVQILRRDEMRTGGDVLPDLAANPPGPGETEPGVASNTLDGTTTGADLVVDPETGELGPVTDDASADAEILYAHAENGVEVVKDFDGVITGGSESPDAVFPMNITVENTGNRPISELVVDDPMPTDGTGAQLRLADVAEPYSYALAGAAPDPANGDPLPTDPADVTVDRTGDLERLTFGFPEGTVLEVGQTYTITVMVRFRLGLTAGTVVRNTAGVTGDRPWDECLTRLDDETGACEADSDVVTIPSGVLRQSKQVKATDDDQLDVIVDPAAPDPGVECTPDDDGFYSYPCTPVIPPGHDETWRVRVDNVGNLPMSKLVIYDRLPTPGDTGSSPNSDSQRGSQWAAILTNDPPPQLVNAPEGATATFYYTTADDYCPDDINDPTNEPICPTDDPQTGWVPLTAGTGEDVYEQIAALKVVITFPEDAMFQPGDYVALEGTSTTPALVPDAGDRSIAWNSAAASAVVEAQNGSSFNLLPTEGTKVGVATASGPLAVNKFVTGEGQEYAPETFQVIVNCTSAVGTWVETELDPITITVTPGEPVTVPNLPYGAVCTLSEDATNGQTDYTVTPQSVTIGEEPDVTQIAVTNEYDLASLELSKQVVSDALDQDGDPVAFPGPYEVTVECTFLGEPVYADGYGPDAPMVVEIADGETVELTGLPVNAECTVTETGTGGSTSQEMTVTAGDDDPVETDGPEADATVTPDGDDGAAGTAVEVTNTFDVGAIDLLKVVDGEGADAYGQGPFTVQVVCTFGQGTGDPATVYDGTVTLGGGGPLEAQIPNLPTGAECAVTEIDDGGATGAVVVPDTVTVGSDEPVEVVVTNTFDVGTIEVDKQLEGLGALYGPGPFEVTLACTYGLDENGDPVPLPIPGGAVRELVPGEPVLYEGLPVGAECTVTETNTFGASSTTMTVDDGEPVDGTTVDVVVPPADDGDPTTVTVTATNTFDTAPLVVRKVVDGDGAAYAPTMPELPPLPEIPEGPITPELLEELLAQVQQYLDDVPFDEFPYQVSMECTTVTGAEVPIPGGGTRAFGPGFPGLYFGLPDGAECTLTETRTGDADHVTIDPNPVTVDGAANVLDPIEVTVTNTYDLGGFTVEKVVDGDAADFGVGPFEVTAACTLRGEEIDVPGGATRELEAGGSVTYGDLPIGAECVVTETDDGGATSSTVSTAVNGGDPGQVVVPESGVDAPVITVTNTFDAGAVTADKVVEFEGDAYDVGPFEVTLACTFQGADLEIPDGANREITPGTPVTWAGLPVGADCVVTETDDGGAASVQVSSVGGGEPGAVTVSLGAVAEVTVTNTFGPPPAPPAPPAPPGPGGGDAGSGWLPQTGAGVMWLIGLAVLTTAAGVALVTVRRRHQH
ncbi:DUF5979 domain-containing protein [Isoptericola sp. NPDC019693]|uniref:DUF5979 domain-containing protein n=1 Tax=Isoptericola sp. NPDC019693 TaxID=3364009 RepID=UPI0037B25480